MLFFKQFKALANYIKENFQDVNTPSDTIVTFSLPDGEPAVVRYNNTGFVEEYGMAYGSVFIEYGEYKTECSDYTQAEETLENLKLDSGNPADDADDPTEAHFIQEADADSLASDVVRFMYDRFPEANFIDEGYLGEKMVLKFEFGKADKEAMRKELAERYGNRVSFGHGNTEYAPEIKFGAIIVNPPAKTITEGAESMDQFVEIDNFPEWAVEPMVNDSWGDWITYYGEKQAKEDFAMIDEYMNANGLCGINPPSDEEYQEGRNEFNSNPAFGKATSTIPVHGVKGEWNSLIDEYDLNDKDDYDTERAVADDIDTAMMDHYDMMNGDIGDFESVNDAKRPVMETTEEIINAPDDVIEIDPTVMTSNSDPLVEYLTGLESFNGWDPADIQIWARDNHDAIQEYYNQCKSLDQAIQMCIDAEKDKFYQDFNKFESVKNIRQKVFCESVTKLCNTAGHPEIGTAVVKLAAALEAAECTGDCVQLDDEPNFDVTIAVDTLDPNPAHYRVAGYDAWDALEKVANDLKAKGHVGYFEDNPTYEEDYYEVAGTFIPSWLVNIEKIA